MFEPTIFKQQHSGFTLIELMVVLVIIGLLACLAIPSYQNYTIRTQVSEGLNLAGEWETAVADFYNTNAAWPSQSDLNDMAAPSVGIYVSNISVTSGVITVTYGTTETSGQISGAQLTLVPYTDANNDVLWQCGLAPAPAATLATGAVAGGTTLKLQQLPTACKP
jgi:type IV pilus assembly protein PilA